MSQWWVPRIQKLAFHFSRFRILGTHHCDKERSDAFKRQVNLHDVLCRFYYADRVVSIFAHQFQSQYYDGNIYVSIEGIASEHSSASRHSSPLLELYHVSLNAVFHYLFVLL